MIKQAWDWFKDNWVVLAVVSVILGILVLAIFQPPRKYFQVPVEFCQEARTGATYVEDIPVQQCAGYDKNGLCTAPFTTWTQQTRVQVQVTCAYTEWRTE